MRLMNSEVASKVAVLLLQRHYGVSAAGTVLEDVQALDSLLMHGRQVYVVVNDVVERHDLFRIDRPQTNSQPIGFDEQFAAFVTVSHEVMLVEDKLSDFSTVKKSGHLGFPVFNFLKRN